MSHPSSAGEVDMHTTIDGDKLSCRGKDGFNPSKKYYVETKGPENLQDERSF